MPVIEEHDDGSLAHKVSQHVHNGAMQPSLQSPRIGVVQGTCRRQTGQDEGHDIAEPVLVTGGENGPERSQDFHEWRVGLTVRNASPHEHFCARNLSPMAELIQQA
jgi:hypothetical protein